MAVLAPLVVCVFSLAKDAKPPRRAGGKKHSHGVADEGGRLQLVRLDESPDVFGHGGVIMAGVVGRVTMVAKILHICEMGRGVVVSTVHGTVCPTYIKHGTYKCIDGPAQVSRKLPASIMSPRHDQSASSSWDGEKRTTKNPLTC